MNLPIKPAALIPLAVTLFALIAQAFAQSPKEKPRVPPGVDPGGVAVAIIGSGIDYTRPEIAARLARDGEGEIIGWDFVDNDRRPFAACRANETPPPTSWCLPFPIELLAIGKPSFRIIVLRASPWSPQILVAAVQQANQTPARIVLLALDQAPPLKFLLDAAMRFPKLYFVGVVDRASMETKTTIFRDNYTAIPSDQSNNQAANAIAWGVARSAEYLVSQQPSIDNNGIRCRFEQAPDFVLLPRPHILHQPPPPPGCPDARPMPR